MKYQTLFVVIILILIVIISFEIIRPPPQKEGMGMWFKPGGLLFNPPMLPPMWATKLAAQKPVATAPPPAPKIPCNKRLITKFKDKLSDKDQVSDASLNTVLYWFIGSEDLRNTWNTPTDSDKDCSEISNYLNVLTDEYNVKSFKDLLQLKNVLASMYAGSDQNIGVRIDRAYDAIKNTQMDYIYDKSSTYGLGILPSLVNTYNVKQVVFDDKKTIPFFPSNTTEDSLLKRFNTTSIPVKEFPEYMNLMHSYLNPKKTESEFGPVYFTKYHDLVSRITKNTNGVQQILEDFEKIANIKWLGTNVNFYDKLTQIDNYMKCWGEDNLHQFLIKTEFIDSKVGINNNFCETHTIFSEYLKNAAFSENETSVHNLEKPNNDTTITLEHYHSFISILDSKGYIFDKVKDANTWLTGLKSLPYRISVLIQDVNLQSVSQGFSTMNNETVFDYITRNLKSLFGMSNRENFSGENPTNDELQIIQNFLPANKTFDVYHDAIEQLFVYRGLQPYATDNNKTLWAAMIESIKVMSDCGIRADNFATLQTNGSTNAVSKKYIKFDGNNIYFVSSDGVMRSIIQNSMPRSETTTTACSNANLNTVKLGDEVSITIRNSSASTSISTCSGTEIKLKMGIPLQPEVDINPRSTTSKSVIGSPLCVLMDRFTNKDSTVRDWMDVLNTTTSYGITTYADLTEFLTGLSDFQVSYSVNYNSFVEHLANFGMTNYSTNKGNYNLFKSSMTQALNYNYNDNASNVNNIMVFFKANGYNISRYSLISLPYLLVYALKFYDSDKAKYKNNALDIQSPVDSNFTGLGINVDDVFTQAILIGTNMGHTEVAGKLVNCVFPSNLLNILSFIYISEYKAIQSWTYPENPETIKTFMQDVGHALTKFSSDPNYRSSMNTFKLLAGIAFLFPALLFEYMAYNLNNNDANDYYMSETQVTYRAPKYRTVNTMP